MEAEPELFQSIVEQLKSSSDTTLRKCYELLVLMLKNTKTDLDSEVKDLGSWQIAEMLDVDWNVVSKLRRKIREVFKVPILLKVGRSYNRFNPRYFLDLREAVERVSGEKLPPITFKQLLLSTELHPSFYFSTYLSGHQLIAVTLNEWENRPEHWNLFEDIAPNNIVVLAYEEKPEAFYVKAIASKSNERIQEILNALEKIAENRVALKIERLTIEPEGKTVNEIRQLMADKEIQEKGYVPYIARALRDCSTRLIQYNQPILEILRRKGWVREERPEDYPRGEVNPFVSLAYNQYLTHEEKRKYEMFGLTKFGEIIRYDRAYGEKVYEMGIALPYAVSSDPSFPFKLLEKVNVRIKGNTLIIKKIGRRGRKPRFARAI